MYNPLYRDPIILKDELQEPLPKEDERNFLPIKATKNEDHFFPYYDPVIMYVQCIYNMYTIKYLAKHLETQPTIYID